MTAAEALRIVGRERPCPHDNHDTQLDFGKTWAKCEDCGRTFPQDRLESARVAASRFDDAIDVLTDAIKRGTR